MASGSRFDRSQSVPEQFGDMRADYDAMRDSKYVRNRSGLAPNGGSSDYHIRNETQYLQLIERARDLCRNASIVDVSIQKAATNIVGDGFTLCPKTGNKQLDVLLFDKWANWSEDREQCDIAKEKSWSEMEELAVISQIRDGDIIGLGTKDGSLQIIESHQCRNPKGSSRKRTKDGKEAIFLGVELSDVRERTKFHIRSEETDPQKTAQSMSSTAYDVRDDQGFRQVFHYYVSSRSSGTRGVTALAPCFTKLAMYDDLDFAKLVQAQALSCVISQRIKDVTRTGLPTTNKPLGATTTETGTDGSSLTIQQVAPGTEFINNPGERLEHFSPDVPNTNYFEHAKSLLTMFFVSIGLPYFMAMMDPTEGSYSAWRGAYDEAKKGFKRSQRQLRDKWHAPIYTWKVRQWIAEDPEIARLAAEVGNNVFKHTWRMPKWTYVQPVEDATAQAFRMRNGLISPSRLHGELSQDWEEIVDETIQDNGYAIVKAIKTANAINKKYNPEPPIVWQQLMSLPTPDSIAFTLPIGQVAPTPPANPSRGNVNV
jgi:capsid protein